jgi:sugar phosphate isomerase/epimerase
MKFPYQPDQPSRRQILTRGGAAAIAAVIGGAGALNARAADGFADSFEYCTFTKWLQMKSFDEMAEIVASMGFNGAEVPVRPKGHVLPENVETELPKMVAALKKNDLKLMVMTSGINAVNDAQRTEVVLKTAADLGVKRFRMAYYKYDLKKPIIEQLEGFRRDLDALVKLCEPLGIKPVYQNHSGSNYVGAGLWDLHELFKNHDPKHVGSAYDIGHASVEGAKSWIIDFNLLRPWIDTVYVKEPAWDDNKLSWGPVGEGVVSDTFFKELKRTKFDGPISLHVEYLGHSDEAMVPTIVEATKKDFATLKEKFNKV